MWRCPSGICIENTEVCNDDRYQCRLYTDDTCDLVIDNSDEDEEMCKTFTCPAGYWKCANNKCINNEDACDGKLFSTDCIDESDEDPEMCKRNHTCNTGYRKCADGICIKETLVCNGYFNCDDGSDELNCEIYTCLDGNIK